MHPDEGRAVDSEPEDPAAVDAEHRSLAAGAAPLPQPPVPASVSRSEPAPGDRDAACAQAGATPEPLAATVLTIAADLSPPESSPPQSSPPESSDGLAAEAAAQGSPTSLLDAGTPAEADPQTEPGPAADLSLRHEASPAQSEGAGDGGGWDPPAAPPRDDEFPGEVEMPLVDHLEELRRRVLRSLLAVVVAAAGCLVFVRPLVKLLEAPARGIRFLQLAPGEFLFVSLKVAGYAGLTLAIPWILFEGLAFVLPGLTRRERRLVAPTVAGSTVLFAAGLAFAWWALVPAALTFLVSYGADVVEPIWSIERYLDFVLLLMVATALAFQLPVLQLLLGALGLVDARRMLGAWRWVVLVSALAGAVLTPSTDPVTMLLLSGAITALYLIGVGLVAVVTPRRQGDPA